MNPLKWIARRILRQELSDLNAAVVQQESAIARSMQDAREWKKLADEQRENGKMLAERLRLLLDKVDAALDVHDSAKAPNSTVKRMARILKGEAP